MKRGRIGKKIGKIKHGDLVVVRWLDANASKNDSWVSELDYLSESTKMLVESAGFFYGVKKGHVRIAADRTRSKIYTDNVSRKFNIPLISVVGVEKFT